jgi:cytochrome c oxidase subunit 4
LALTALTVAAAFVNLGRMNAVVALTIACVKALLVTLYFMHARYSSKLTWVIIASGALWLGIMLTLTITDYLSRGAMGTSL